MSEEAISVDQKKRARRRLVGAAALALLAIIVLPIVMDSEPKPTGQEIEIHIPSQDGKAAATPTLPEAAVAAPVDVEPQSKASTPPDTALAKAETSASIKVPAPVPAPAPKPKVAEPAATLNPPKPEKTSDAIKAAAVLAGKESSRPEQWVVQIGAYRSETTVKQLTAKLKELGVRVYTEKAESPVGATRVRIGPFTSREAAEKAQVRIKSIGVDGKVTQQ